MPLSSFFCSPKTVLTANMSEAALALAVQSWWRGAALRQALSGVQDGYLATVAELEGVGNLFRCALLVPVHCCARCQRLSPCHQQPTIPRTPFPHLGVFYHWLTIRQTPATSVAARSCWVGWLDRQRQAVPPRPRSPGTATPLCRGPHRRACGSGSGSGSNSYRRSFTAAGATGHLGARERRRAQRRPPSTNDRRGYGRAFGCRGAQAPG